MPDLPHMVLPFLPFHKTYAELYLKSDALDMHAQGDPFALLLHR